MHKSVLELVATDRLIEYLVVTRDANGVMGPQQQKQFRVPPRTGEFVLSPRREQGHQDCYEIVKVFHTLNPDEEVAGLLVLEYRMSRHDVEKKVKEA